MKRRTAADRVVRALRRVNFEGSLFGQTVAVRLGLSESDVDALERLIDAGASTAGWLAEAMGLTTGAVTRVIDRLEQAGYVRRTTDPADRRRVIVEVVPERVSRVEALLDRMGDAGADVLQAYSEEELRVIDDFLTRMAGVAHAEAVTMRDSPVVDGASTTEHSASIRGLQRAKLAFRSGVSELAIRGDVSIADLYRARFDGPVPKVRVRDGTVSIQYGGSGRPWDWRKRRADLTLSTGLPWDIEISGGTSSLDGDLRAVDVRGFELQGGTDQVRLALGRPSAEVPVRLVGGANTLRFERPAGVALRLIVTGGPGGIEFDGRRRGSASGRTVLDSPGAAAAADRFAIEVVGGSSRIVVAEEPGTATRR